MKLFRSSILLACLGLSLPGLSTAQTESARGRILDRNGAVLAETAENGQRKYPEGTLVGHLTGYLISGSRNSRGAAAGIEKSQDTSLAKGKDVALTLDIELQKICAEVFPDDSDGSVVVIDPRNGEILAMASFPSFDPNKFAPTISEENYRSLVNDKRKPLYNRSINAKPPGSVFKIPVAVAAAAQGIDTTVFTCTGAVKIGQRSFRCWIARNPQGQHGDQALTGALMNSCNAWFYQASELIGYPSIQQAAQAFGFGRATACGLPNEASGNFPDPSKRKRDHLWTAGDLAMLAIGQGEITATPLQLASLGATLADNGEVRTPRLLASDKRPPSGNVLDLGLTEKQWQSIRDALRRNVNEDGGTASKARSEAVVVAGKSGTAMNGGLPGDTTGWFVGFAPFEKPTLAICVQVEEAKGSDAAKIAGQILEQADALAGQ